MTWTIIRKIVSKVGILICAGEIVQINFLSAVGGGIQLFGLSIVKLLKPERTKKTLRKRNELYGNLE